MPNLNAALGVSQMMRLKQFLDAKITLRDAYQEAFCNIEGCQFYIHNASSKSNYWLQSIVLKNVDLAQRNQIIEAAQRNGLFVRPIWGLLAKLPAFSGCPSMNLPFANALVDRTINIPSSCYLGHFHG